MKKLVLPKSLVVKGRIISAKAVTPEQNGNFDRDTDIVTVELSEPIAGDETGALVVALFISNAMSETFGKRHLLFEGNFVTFNVDQNIKDVTGFLDDPDDTEMVAHKHSYLSVTDFFSSTESDIAAFLKKSAVKANYDALAAVFPDMAVADLLPLVMDAATKQVDAEIVRIAAKRDTHKIVETEHVVAPKTTRKDVVTKQLAEIEAVLADKSINGPTRNAYEKRKARLTAELEA